MANDAKPVPQAGAVPVADGKICLVTTSNGKAWTIPKGMIDPGNTAEETARQETWEEAGLTGELWPEPLGRYRYDKWGLRMEVLVYRLDVTRVHDDWPEKDLRRRQWLTLEEAQKRIDNDGLKQILEKVCGRQPQHLHHSDE